MQTSSRLTVLTGTSTEVSRLVRRGDVGIGIRYFPSDDEAVDCETIGREPPVVVGSPRLSLLASPAKRANDLRSQRWIGFPPARTSKEDFGQLLLRSALAPVSSCSGSFPPRAWKRARSWPSAVCPHKSASSKRALALPCLPRAALGRSSRRVPWRVCARQGLRPRCRSACGARSRPGSGGAHPDPSNVGGVRLLRMESSLVPRAFLAMVGGAARPDPARRLTKREGEVFTHLLRGAAVKEIATRLGCAPSTVNRHITAIVRKSAFPDARLLIARFR